MRDIVDYSKRYEGGYGFEKYQVAYRRRKVIEQIDKYKPKSLLEIGCGLDPIGVYVEGLDSYTIVEPSKSFCFKAWRLFMTNVEELTHMGFIHD